MIPSGGGALQMDGHAKVALLRREFRDLYAQELATGFDEFQGHAMSAGQTPIENMMALALNYAMISGHCFGWVGAVFFARNGPIQFKEIAADLPIAYGIGIWPQAHIGRYRADFVVRFADPRGGYALGAIECDGHEHHDLTREQARHDRARDRYFQDVGLLILRYPGSEIWRSALKCAVDALCILERRARGPGAAQWRPVASSATRVDSATSEPYPTSASDVRS